MTDETSNPDFQRGWQAAIQAAQHWHENQANQAMVLSRRTRFPKNLERDAALHRSCVDLLATLCPDDV